MKIKSIALSLLLAFSGMSVVAMQGPTYYDILGIPKTATIEEIKSTFKKLAMKNHPDQNPGDKVAEERFKNISTAYDVLQDASVRKKYDNYLKHPTGKPFDPLEGVPDYFEDSPTGNQQSTAGNTHAAGHSEDQDYVMFLAGIIGATKTYSYLTLAWDQYTMQKNFLAVKKHAELQLKNTQENKPVTPMHEALDLTWVMRLRQGAKPSSIEQAIDQFDRLAMQNPKSLPAVCPQLVKITDAYSNAIGSGTTSLVKAAAVVSIGAIGYLTSDKWLPQVLSSRLFPIALRFLFS